MRCHVHLFFRTAMLVTKIHYHRLSKQLDVTFDKHQCVQFSAEFLRVHSPSAEVQGHGQPLLVTNKKDVTIDKIEPVGHYAVRLTFSDHHNTGLYSWEYLTYLAQNQETLWQQYLNQLKNKKASRDPLIPIQIKH